MSQAKIPEASFLKPAINAAASLSEYSLLIFDLGCLAHHKSYIFSQCALSFRRMSCMVFMNIALNVIVTPFGGEMEV